MLIKAFKLIKENILMMLVFFALTLLFHIVNIFLTAKITEGYNYNMYFFKMMLLYFILFLQIGIMFLFFVGYFYMLSETIKKGKNKIKDFYLGIKKFFVRMLLAGLLLAAMYFGLTIIVMIISAPIAIGIIYNSPDLLNDFNRYQEMATYGIQQVEDLNLALQEIFRVIIIVISSVTIVLTSLFSPLIALWIPSMYLDDIGVIESLKRGFFAGKKKYWILVFCALIMYIPVAIYMFNLDITQTYNITIPYVVMMISQPVVLIAYYAITFVIYNQYKNNQLEKVNVS